MPLDAIDGGRVVTNVHIVKKMKSKTSPLMLELSNDSGGTWRYILKEEDVVKDFIVLGLIHVS